MRRQKKKEEKAKSGTTKIPRLQSPPTPFNSSSYICCTLIVLRLPLPQVHLPHRFPHSYPEFTYTALCSALPMCSISICRCRNPIFSPTKKPLNKIETPLNFAKDTEFPSLMKTFYQILQGLQQSGKKAEMRFSGVVRVGIEVV